MGRLHRYRRLAAQVYVRPAPEEVDKWHLEFLKAAEFIASEHHAEVEAMIHDLELEFWGAIKLDQPPEEASTDSETEKKTE